MGLDAPLRRTRRWLTVGGLAVAAAWLPAPAEAKPKPPPKPKTFTVEMAFVQRRAWTYNYEQVGTDCKLSDSGNGFDRASLRVPEAPFNLQGRNGFAGLAVKGHDIRTGTMIHTVATPNYPGADCGGPETTTADPETGCTDLPAPPASATLSLVGKRLLLRWDGSASVPDFVDCPYFEGSNQATDANALPSNSYRNLFAEGVDRKALLAATAEKPAVAKAVSAISRVENCAVLVEPCAEGVTYNATASVETKANFYFRPERKP